MRAPEEQVNELFSPRESCDLLRIRDNLVDVSKQDSNRHKVRLYGMSQKVLFSALSLWRVFKKKFSGKIRLLDH